jgi:hypothetical protein
MVMWYKRLVTICPEMGKLVVGSPESQNFLNLVRRRWNASLSLVTYAIAGQGCT